MAEAAEGAAFGFLGGWMPVVGYTGMVLAGMRRFSPTTPCPLLNEEGSLGRLRSLAKEGKQGWFRTTPYPCSPRKGVEALIWERSKPKI